jgi:siroheme synthase-like protein
VPFAFPISLEVIERRALVIGRDPVAMGKTEALMAAGAEVTVIASGPLKRLDALAAQGATILRRGYRRGDLEGAFICIASDPDEEVRRAIFEEARANDVLINMVDDVPHSDWAAPAIVRRGDLILAISTGGRSPSLARRLREELDVAFGPEWEDAMEVLSDLREESLRLYPDFDDRAERWRSALDTRELIDLLREGHADEARQRILSRLAAG